MQITIRVHAEAAPGLTSRGGPTPLLAELLQTARELGVSLVPLHPNVNDPHLRSYYAAEVADSAAAERALAGLRQCRAVAAAYIKPPDALP